MYCPIFLHAYHTAGTNSSGNPDMSFDDTHCKEGECAWWERNTGTCGMLTSSYLQGRQVAIKEAKMRR